MLRKNSNFPPLSKDLNRKEQAAQCPIFDIRSHFFPLILSKGFWSVENDKYPFQRNDEKHIIEHKIKNFKLYLSQPIRKNIYKNELFRISQIIHD